jgi:hypothetical protein
MRWTGYDPDTDIPSQDEYIARCPACGDPIDYCQGHGEMGDPVGFAILAAHDGGDHTGCHPEGCDESPSRDPDLNSDDWNEPTFDIPGSDEAREERQSFGEAY